MKFRSSAVRSRSSDGFQAAYDTGAFSSGVEALDGWHRTRTRISFKTTAASCVSIISAHRCSIFRFASRHPAHHIEALIAPQPIHAEIVFIDRQNAPALANVRKPAETAPRADRYRRERPVISIQAGSASAATTSGPCSGSRPSPRNIKTPDSRASTQGGQVLLFASSAVFSLR